MSYAVLCGYRGFSRQMAPYVYDISREGDSDSVESGEKSFFSAPSWESNRRSLAYETSMVPQVRQRTSFMLLLSQRC
jgi:hypothetical protein